MAENMKGVTPEAEESVSGTAAEGLHAGNSNNDAGAEGDGREAGAEGRDFTDVEGEDGGAGAAEVDKGTDAGEDKGKKPGQSPEERAENARRRREQEQKALVDTAKKQARVEAILEVTGGVNPWTKQPMKDAQDVAVYERMRRIERAGGDPIADYAAATAEDARQAEATRAQAENDAKWYRDDLTAFKKAYPNVDVEALLADPDFNDYATAQVKARVPLSDIYGGYKRLEAKFSRDAEARVKAAQDSAAQTVANARVGIGGKSGEAAPAGDVFFTKAQVEAMAPSEISRNLDAIQKSMRKW